MAGETFIKPQGGRRHINFLVGEEHTRMHHWWLTVFSPKRVEAWRQEHIRPTVDRLIDRFAGDSRADLVEQFAAAPPARVIAAVMGFPHEDDAWLAGIKHHMDALQRFFDPAAPAETPGTTPTRTP